MPRIDPRNRTRFWQDAQVSGLSCLHADFTCHTYAPHSHDALVVAVTEIGGAEFQSRGETNEVHPSVLLVFNPDEPHSGRMGRSHRWRYRGLYLNEAALDDVMRALDLDVLPHFTRNMVTDRSLIADFLRLHGALEGGGEPREQRELIVEALGRLFRHSADQRRLPPPPRDRCKIDRVKALMRDSFSEDLTLDAMAAEIGLSPYQLIGAFKRVTGLTPHTYLTQLRLRVAVSALTARMSIAEAAVAAGFYDQSALTRHFKRSYGITPRQYVRALPP